MRFRFFLNSASALCILLAVLLSGQVPGVEQRAMAAYEWVQQAPAMPTNVVITANATSAYRPPHDAHWPVYDAKIQLFVAKIDDENLETDGVCEFGVTTHTIDNCDPLWIHLHQGHMGGESVGLQIHPWSQNNNYSNSVYGSVDFGMEVRYYMGGVAVTDWVAYPWKATVRYDNPALASFKCGIYDVTVDVRFNGRNAGRSTTTMASVSSATTFTVQSGQGVQYAVGDYVWIARVGGYPYEFRKITAKNGDQLTIASALKFGSPVAGDEVHLLERDDFRTRASFLHFHLNGHPNGQSTVVPLIEQDCQYCAGDTQFAARSSIEYVNLNESKMRSWPLVDDPEAWHEIPCAECEGGADLYQVMLAPHTEQLGFSLQMLWQEPAGTVDAGLKFARALTAKFDETHFYPNLSEGHYGHNRLPYQDGERGQCWMSPYAGGRVDALGRFIFTEPGGRFGYLDATGKCETWAGYRTKRGQAPIWITKPLAQIRAGQDLVGSWPQGIETFRNPLDADIDPQNPTHYYIVDEGRNAIFKCVLTAGECVMTVFAGATDGTAGYTNATGTSARFNGPTSLAWDLTGTYLYVADLKNDAVRRINRSGVVTTLFGQGPSDGSRANAILSSGCATTVYGTPAPTTNRTCSRFTGTDPDSMSPFVIRMFSDGDLAVMDAGFSAIRRYDIATDTATKIVAMGNPRYNSASDMGWQWMDVDRWGNSGPLDGIYFLCFQCSGFTEVFGARTNEGLAWSSSDGSEQHFVFGPDADWTPDGFGSYYQSDPPHYLWMAAVDPRGGVYLNGSGEHGMTLLRKKKATDPDPASLSDYSAGEVLWARQRPSPLLKYGYGGSGSMLGFNSTWDITTSTTDAEIKTMFRISDTIWNDTDKRRQILEFLRANRGSKQQ